MLDRLSDAAQGAASSVIGAVQAQLASLLASWTSAQRLYTLEGEGPVSELMVERFNAVDAISEPLQLSLSALSVHTHIQPHALLGRRITLNTTLSDGSRSHRSGLVFHAALGSADGGLVRYQLTAATPPGSGVK